MDEVVLTTKERHQLLAVLRELDQNAPTEQRRSPRQKVFLTLPLRIISKGEKMTRARGAICNISPTGVGIRLRRPLEDGCKFLISLGFRDGGGWLVLCEVRNCIQLDEDEYKIGARFMDRIDDPEGTAKPPMDWLL